MNQDIATVQAHLQQTLSHDGSIRKQSEKFLGQLEKAPGYAITLLQIVESGANGTQPVSLAAAITFKNFINRNWKINEDGESKINENDRNKIKQTVVTLMLKSPEMYQKQLSEAISIIGREDFPEKWPNLLDEMKAHFSSGDFVIINGVLRTAHTLFKRYRHEFRSDNLWREIKLVLESFAAPLTELLDQTVRILPNHMNNQQVIKTLYSSLILISKIFFSLNYQDLPEFFEDNMEKWMTHFLTLLDLDVPLLNTDDESEAGLVEFLRSQICENVGMYAQKYDEEFASYLPKFIERIWALLTKTGSHMKYDLLVSNAINYLRSVCERPQYKQVFEGPALQSICEKVVVPNMQFRPSDLEQFEDNPDEYIRRDMEGSDVDTRRRAACDLVRGLTKQFEAETTQLFSAYVQTMLASYAEDPAKNWASKDVVIYLVTSLASQGTTAKHGTTKANKLVDLHQFFVSHIVPELQNKDPNHLVVVKADCLRFVVTFRNLLGRDNLLNVLPLVVNLIDAPDRVLHTYAAHVIERLLMIKADNNQPLVTRELLNEYGKLDVVLSKLIAGMHIEGSEENEYLMKALMRVISLCRDQVFPFISELVQKLKEKLELVSKNPSKPYFNHYLFESISLCIRITLNQDPSFAASFEQAFNAVFIHILVNDVTEFVPYVFQLMSLLLELQPTVPDNHTYLGMFEQLLTPTLWENSANIFPLVRLIQAIIEKGGERIAENKLDSLFGLVQKLVSSRANDQYGLNLLASIIESLPSNKLEKYINKVFELLFTRLMRSKTTKYVRGLLVFFSVFITKYSPDAFFQLIESIQSNMFSMVLEKVIISDLQKVLGKNERRTCIVGFTKLLTGCSSLLAHNFDKLWVQLLEALIAVFELPEDSSSSSAVDGVEHFSELNKDGYQPSYSQLSFARKKSTLKIENPKSFLATSLAQLSKRHQIGNRLSHVNTDAQAFLKTYLNEAQVQIS